MSINTNNNVRKYTRLLYSLMDEGLLSREDVVYMCLSWMSEDDVKEMMYTNDVVHLADDVDEEY